MAYFSYASFDNDTVRSMSRLLVSGVVLIIAAVTLSTLHIIVIIVIVIEEVRAFIRGWNTCADAVLGQRGWNFNAISLCLCFGSQDLFPEEQQK